MTLGARIRAWLDPPSARRPVAGGVDTPASAGEPVGLAEAASSDADRERPARIEHDNTPRALDPTVREWLAAELPRLRDAGLITTGQAERIARRYAVSIAAGPARATTPETSAGAAAGASGEAGADRAEVARRPAGRPSLAPFLSEHGVSVVLYLGAFLVVSAVIIYLAYNWGQVGGATKLGTLIGLTAGFLTASAVCLPRPSIRPAGQTFLAIGALLVPANVAAAYAFLYADGPLPQAAFWLLGAATAGGLYGALSARLGSRAYGALAAPTPPVGAAALASLIGLPEAWWAPVAEGALAVELVAAAGWPRVPLAQAARAVAAALLPLGALISLLALFATGSERWAAPAGLLVMALATGWEATRRGGRWLAGPLAALLLLPPAALAAADAEGILPYAIGLAATSWLYVLVARRLEGRPAIVWDLAGAIVCWLPPLLMSEESRPAAALFASGGALLAALAVARRAPALLYPALLAADLAFVRAMAALGAPDSPVWRLGVALWPLALAWWAGAAVAPRRWSHPFWAAALLTGVAAAGLVAEQRGPAAVMAATFALASVVAAWRTRVPLGLLATGSWLALAAYQAGAWAGLDQAGRFVACGLVAWPLLAAGRQIATPPSPASPSGPAWERRLAAIGADDWSGAARTAAVAAAGFSALAVTAVASGTDPWLVGTGLAWANLAAVLGALARIGRSPGFALAAALAVVPALLAGIARTHAEDPRAYALPTGLYLLAVAHVTRRIVRDRRRGLATGLAALGAGALLVPSLIESLGSDQLGLALWTAFEGLVLAGWGIATRWRPLVAAGVAAVVAVTLRQLFDALNALPSWALLGGTGLALLAAAVVLLLLRDRLLRAGRTVTDRWSSWD
jgi:hypothetical protein